MESVFNKKGIYFQEECQYLYINSLRPSDPNAGILLIGPLGTNFSEILIEIHTFSLKKYFSKCRLENGGHFVSASMC